MGDLLISLLRGISSFLDGLVAWVIDEVYKLIMYIADTNIFGGEALKMFSRRIYVLLSLFMLFKLSFSLVNYLINPDNFYSKEQGFGKIITNSMVVLFLIAVTPFAFEQLYNVQGKLLKNKTVEQIILGVGNTSSTDNEQGQEISFTVFSAFFNPNPKGPGMTACENMYSGTLSDVCINNVSAHGGSEAGEALVEAFGGTNGENSKSAAKLVSTPLSLAKDDGEFLFDYKFLLSTITGIIVAYLLLITAIDISIRSVKLGFLQLIAPIPIISYIDPESSKKGMFKNWLSQTLKTYVDLFIRLAAIFFAVFIISLVSRSESEFITMSGNVSDHPFVVIFIIIGALMFANQIPKLISDLIPGAKLDGGFTLNPMKKIGTSPLASAAVGGVVGGAGAMVANTMAQYANRKNIMKDLKDDSLTKAQKLGTLARVAGSPIAGGLRGTFVGAGGGLASGGKGSALDPAKAAISTSNQARNRRSTIIDLNRANPDNKISFMSRNVTEPVREWAGIHNKDGDYGELDKKSKEIAIQIANYDQQEDAFRREYSKITAEGLTTGIYNLGDYDYASQGVTETHNIDGQEVTKTIYDFDKYRERVEMENKTRHSSEQIEILDRKTYDEVTGLSRAINEIDTRRELLRKQKGRIDKGIERPGKKNK